MSTPDLSEVEHPTLERVAPSTVRDLTSPFDVPDVEEMKCPECGGIYKGLGTHWQWSPDHRPSLTEKQRELVTGLMMGDGTLHRGREGSNPSLVVNMVTPRYLEWLDERFGVLSTGVRLRNTATESARQNRDSGFCPDALAENYQDTYRWQTRSLPELHDFDWYGDEGKRWPSDLYLTSTVLKHWFAGDGHYHKSGSNDRIEIAMSNEVEHTDKVDAYFERANLPTPNNYDTFENGDGRVGCNAAFTAKDSYELFEYMGEPLPDFEYKWPDDHETNPYKFPEEYRETNSHDDLKKRLRARDYRGPFASATITDEELRSVPIEPEINVDGTDRVTFDRHDLESWLCRS